MGVMVGDVAEPPGTADSRQNPPFDARNAMDPR
jgi:hypothetical protein